MESLGLRKYFGVWILIFLGTGGMAKAAESKVPVLEVSERDRWVTVGYDARARWAPNDSICLYDTNNGSVCGVVKQASTENLRISISDGEIKFKKGAFVSLKRLARPLASLNSTELTEQVEERKTHDVAVGVATGFNYFYPTLHLQQAIDKNYSVGLMPLYANYSADGSNVTAWGGFATVSYFYTHFPFRGFYGQAGVGFYKIQASVGSISESHGQAAFMGTINWRGRASWELGLDIGVSLGLQYVVPTDHTLTDNFSGVLPLLMVSLGYPF